VVSDFFCFQTSFAFEEKVPLLAQSSNFTAARLNPFFNLPSRHAGRGFSSQAFNNLLSP
jgi:hypothetical protein